MKLLVYYESKDAYIKEFLKAVLSKLRMSGLSVGVLGLIFSYLTYRDHSLLVAGLLLAAGFISIFVGIFVLPMTFKEFKGQEEKSTGGESQVMIRFLEDRAEIHQGKSHLEIAYDYIERVYPTESLYIFQLGKNTGFYVPKEALNERNREDFRFLLEEGPLAKLPKKPRGFFSNK